MALDETSQDRRAGENADEGKPSADVSRAKGAEAKEPVLDIAKLGAAVLPPDQSVAGAKAEGEAETRPGPKVRTRVRVSEPRVPSPSPDQADPSGEPGEGAEEKAADWEVPQTALTASSDRSA